MRLGLFHFQLLYQVLESIHYIYEEHELANTVLKSISTALNAEGGTIFKLMPDQSLYPLASYGAPIEKLREAKFAVGQGVVGWVAEHAQPVKVDRPGQDTRFLGMIDSSTGFKTRTILAAPIIAKGKTIGVIEFLNRKEGPFNIPDLELVSMVGREVGIAFENVNLIKGLNDARQFLEAVANSLSAGLVVSDQQGRLLKVNPRGLEILGLDKDESVWVAQPLGRFFASAPGLMKIIKGVIDDGAPVVRQETVITIDGKNRTIGYSGVPVNAKTGERLGSALLYQDITSL
ncbi:MAG: GAF domain-containing protein [Elusimicrobiota bacterium]